MYFGIFEICFAICLHGYLVFLCLTHKDQLQKKMPLYLRWFVSVALAAILMCFFHPGPKGKFFVTQQMFVSFTMYTEAFSLVS